MKEVYRKFGCTVRYENGTWITVHEAGEAIESGDTFIAAPLRAVWARHSCLAGQTRMSGPHIPLMERLVLSEGIALHQFNDIEWRDETRRLYVSLTHKQLRAVIELTDFDFELVNRVAESLARAGEEREVLRIRIAPHVANKIDLPNLWQNPGGRDGKGQLIESMPAAQSRNWYRPSYRVRPIRRPFNLSVRCARTEVDPTLPQAIATLDGGRLLIDDGREVYPASVRIVSVDAAAPDGEIESTCR